MHTRTLAATIAAAGALTLGSVGVAFAAATTGSAPSGSGSAGVTLAAATTGSAPSGSALTASSTHACGPKPAARLYLLEHRQSTVQSRITALQAAEANAGAHPRLAARITRRIGLLHTRETAVSDRIQRLEGRCPGLTPTPPTTSGSGLTPPPPTTSGSSSTSPTPDQNTSPTV